MPRITFPVCDLCGSDDYFQCFICGRITCRDCVTYVGMFRYECHHSLYKEQGNNWDAKFARVRVNSSRT